jgi:hypothetical protein
MNTGRKLLAASKEISRLREKLNAKIKLRRAINWCNHCPGESRSTPIPYCQAYGKYIEKGKADKPEWCKVGYFTLVEGEFE